MRWTVETDEDDSSEKQHVLEVRSEDLLAQGYVEFWRRLLSAALSEAPLRQWSSVILEIREKQDEEDEAVGRLRAHFEDSRGEVCAHIGAYVIRSERFTCIQSGDSFRDLMLTM